MRNWRPEVSRAFCQTDELSSGQTQLLVTAMSSHKHSTGQHRLCSFRRKLAAGAWPGSGVPHSSPSRADSGSIGSPGVVPPPAALAYKGSKTRYPWLFESLDCRLLHLVASRLATALPRHILYQEVDATCRGMRLRSAAPTRPALIKVRPSIKRQLSNAGIHVLSHRYSSP